MTLILELSPERETALNAYAQSQGVSAEQWLQRLVEERLQSASLSAPLPSSGAKDERPIWEIIIDDMKDVPPEDLATLPKDGASQIDHYIYGTPKREA